MLNITDRNPGLVELGRLKSGPSRFERVFGVLVDESEISG